MEIKIFVHQPVIDVLDAMTGQYLMASVNNLNLTVSLAYNLTWQYKK